VLKIKTNKTLPGVQSGRDGVIMTGVSEDKLKSIIEESVQGAVKKAFREVGLYADSNAEIQETRDDLNFLRRLKMTVNWAAKSIGYFIIAGICIFFGSIILAGISVFVKTGGAGIDTSGIDHARELINK
jgi:hypothetical protein